MAHRNEFIEYLLELLQADGSNNSDHISARAMFGGYGLYLNSLEQGNIMFALVADDVLYFKTDDGNRSDFEKRNLEAFKYERSDKIISMSYHEAPSEVFDDQDEMALWAGKAIDAAKRSSKKRHTK